MFFKKLFLLCFICCFPLAPHAMESFFSQFRCTEVIKEYSIPLIKGELKDWQKQQKFFHCVKDFLKLARINHDAFSHDPSRDYFTKDDLKRLFFLVGYNERSQEILANRVLLIKKALLGGDWDKVEDRKVIEFFHLIDSYEKAYFILHEQIPVFQKLFSGESVRITPEESDMALNQLRTAFMVLEPAYTHLEYAYPHTETASPQEKISYKIDDLYDDNPQDEKAYGYGTYLKRAQLFEEINPESAEQQARFIQHLFEGLFYPQTEIQGRDWRVAFDALYDMINLAFYHKTYFSQNLPPIEFNYRILESVDILLSSLQLVELRPANRKKGFPLKSLDKILIATFSYFNQASNTSSSGKSLFSNISSSSVSLFTRTLTCFSLSFLDKPAQKDCNSQWNKGDSSVPTVTLSFSDAKFEVFPDQIRKIVTPDASPAFIGVSKLKFLRKWIDGYKQDIERIFFGEGRSVAENRHFEHWMNPFFGWDQKHPRITFGSFHLSNGLDKAHQLLNYQVFLPLLFSSHLPENFFSPTNKQQVSIPFKTWAEMVNEISPALVVLQGNGGYPFSWRKAFVNLFNFADSFLHSSNRDGLLNAKELTDLTIQLLEGIKNSRLAYSKIYDSCNSEISFSCAAEQIINDPDILEAYPRFKGNLSHPELRSKYKEKIETILEQGGEPIQDFSLIPLFILLQIMEINYNLINTNQSFYLESDEIEAFAKGLGDLLISQMPQLLRNEHQARDWLMYSLKTGNIPFFTGDAVTTPSDFNLWRLQVEKRQEAFQVSPSTFHLVILDFYILYQRYH